MAENIKELTNKSENIKEVPDKSIKETISNTAFQDVQIENTISAIENDQSASGPRLSISGFKEWSLSTFKCTKQLLTEQFFVTPKTLDNELEIKITDLMETKQKYRNLVNTAQILLTHMQNTSKAQKAFSELLNDFSQRSQPLYEPFFANAEIQKFSYKYSNKIEDVLIMFIHNLTTLSEKTIDDTILNIKQYDFARLEYDAYRSDFEKLKLIENSDSNKLKEVESKYKEQYIKFEKIKADLKTKIKLLEENKLKVLHRNLVILFEAYVKNGTSNQDTIDQITSKYNFNSSLENSSFLNL